MTPKNILGQLPDSYAQLVLDIAAKRGGARESEAPAAGGKPGSQPQRPPPAPSAVVPPPAK